MQITVMSDAKLGTVLDWGTGPVRCAVGRGGIAIKDSEGDGITPVGRLPMRRVLYRADRLPRPDTALPVAEIKQDDGWCDAPGDPNYNLPVQLPYSASAENMWRADRVYDVVVVLGFNDAPVVPGKGSAIFLHLAREDFRPTEGCVAVALPDMLALLKAAAPGDSLVVGG